jgi:phytoene dehydrogenase-like protein
VIIGGGHNGLTLGAYLARSGLEVLVCERRHEEGGGLCTEELTRPGFLHNVHANYHTFVGMAPPLVHLQVQGHGVRFVRPEVQMASIFEDGTALTVHADPDRTAESIARFSEQDAQTFSRLEDEVHGFVDLVLGTLMYRPPVSIKELTKALATFGVEDRSELLSVKLRRETIDQFLDRHFVHPKVKAHLAFHAAVCGYANDVPGLAMSFPLLAGKIDNWHLCVGGSHRLAHALWRDLAQHGGVMVADAEVTAIVVEDGRAVGVRLVDGTEVTARRLVASTVT